jgi:hypothetical protein
MARECLTSQNNPMLPYKKKLQLSRVLRRLAIRAGVNPGTKTIRFHCLRKFLCDHLSSFMSESKWKQIVGKKISEGAYVSPDTLRTDYARAMVEISFPQPRADLEKRAQVSERIMSKILAGEQLDEADREDIKTYGIQLRERAKKEPCEDGRHCQRVVTEEELPELLAEGFKVVATLPSGKVVIDG